MGHLGLALEGGAEDLSRLGGVEAAAQARRAHGAEGRLVGPVGRRDRGRRPGGRRAQAREHLALLGGDRQEPHAAAHHRFRPQAPRRHRREARLDPAEEPGHVEARGAVGLLLRVEAAGQELERHPLLGPLQHVQLDRGRVAVGHPGAARKRGGARRRGRLAGNRLAGDRRRRDGAVGGGDARAVHVLEPVEVRRTVLEAGVHVPVLAALGRGPEARDERGGEPRPGPVGGCATVEVEAEVVELGGGLPLEHHGGVGGRGREAREPHRGRPARRLAPQRRLGQSERLRVVVDAVLRRCRDRAGRLVRPAEAVPRPGAQLVCLDREAQLVVRPRVALDLHPVSLVGGDPHRAVEGEPARRGARVQQVVAADRGAHGVDEHHAVGTRERVPLEVERPVLRHVAVEIGRGWTRAPQVRLVPS